MTINRTGLANIDTCVVLYKNRHRKVEIRDLPLETFNEINTIHIRFKSPRFNNILLRKPFITKPTLIRTQFHIPADLFLHNKPWNSEGDLLVTISIWEIILRKHLLRLADWRIPWLLPEVSLSNKPCWSIFAFISVASIFTGDAGNNCSALITAFL